MPAVARPATSAKPPEPKKRSVLAPLAIGIAVLLIAIAAGAWYFLVANRPAAVATNARLSIVVLPFTNLSGDPAQDYIVDAVTDELTTSLARNLRNSFVIARNTAFTYKGKPIDAKAIGKDLGVHYVLEGSVQPKSAELRVNAQLIDANSGAHLWAEQFDTPRADLLQMQDEIVTHLAPALVLQVHEVEAARFKRPPTTNPDAVDLALRCNAAELKAGFIGKDADAGFRLCEQALAIDPNNVHALGILSFKFWLPVLYGRSADPKSDIAQADELLSRVLAVDPNDAYGHLYKSYVLRLQSRIDNSIAEAERALAVYPQHSGRLVSFGFSLLLQSQNMRPERDRPSKTENADVSRSIDDGEFALERRGYAEAIQSQKLLDAISTGPHGAIALAYVEWAGESEQMIVVDWAIIRKATDARAFAASLSGAPTSRARASVHSPDVAEPQAFSA